VTRPVELIPGGRRYVTVDVFTDQLFGGNPLAVALAREL